MQYVRREYPLSEEEIEARKQEKLKREKELRLRNNRLGVTVFQISWIMIFIAMLVTYWQLGFDPGWRPSPEQAPGPLFPTIATIALIASTWLAHRSLQIVRHTAEEEAPRFLDTWLFSLILGTAFLIIMIWQFFEMPALLFGLIYRLLIGFHAVHAIVIGFMMFQVWRLGRDGRYTSENFWSVEGAMRLWDFVLIAWILFYAVLYIPFLMQ